MVTIIMAHSLKYSYTHTCTHTHSLSAIFSKTNWVCWKSPSTTSDTDEVEMILGCIVLFLFYYDVFFFFSLIVCECFAAWESWSKCSDGLCDSSFKEKRCEKLKKRWNDVSINDLLVLFYQEGPGQLQSHKVSDRSVSLFMSEISDLSPGR